MPFRSAKNVRSIELEALFQAFHPSQVIVASHRSGTPLGFAFVLNETDASQALEQPQGVMDIGMDLNHGISIVLNGRL